MADFFEIDFLDVETRKSGDAITVHYEIDGQRMIHVVDGGFDAMAQRIIDHVVTHYNNKPIDHVVVTHPDGDHACGLRGVVERCNVGTLWMLRPWLYSDALAEAADFAPIAGIFLPGVHRFQVPHHGSRRNVSTELLDRWLGPRLPERPAAGQETFMAICSSAKADPDHPRRSVERAFVHRGARFITTEEGDVTTGLNAPPRTGWGPIPVRPYPEDYEE